ncbi:WD repeat-containing protein 70-like [Lineus longissimus]|uniref:WD repeat-containing protein 70-like n=1 Tax=Lineus longissimus TaxID=88925 RepID=UPI00315D8F34
MADEEDKNMEDVMGFSGFGSKKKARTFDFMAMFEETKKTAVERSQQVLANREEVFGGNSSVTSVLTSKLPVRGPERPKATQSNEKKEKSASSSSNDSHSSGDCDSSDDVICPPVPPILQHDEDDDMIGPPLPDHLRTSDAEGEDLDDDSPVSKIPNSHEIVLEHGSKTVSALALDPSGARLVSGSYDYDLKLWDFAGMDARLQFFRTLRPCECHQIKSVEYSMTGDAILVVAGNAQPKIYDRDGFEMMECPKGDQYITDQKNTKGHTAMTNSGCWNPRVKEEFMTCSNDCTVRLWDVTQGKNKHKDCIKPRSQQGRKTIPTTCTYSNDGRYVAAACNDGSIQIWDHKRGFVNVNLVNRGCHMNGSDTSCIRFSYDGNVLASRGGDNTLKLWDIRKFKQPLCVADSLFNLFPMTDCVFSPDNQLVATGVSLKKGETDGKLIFFDRNTLNKVTELTVSNSSVVRCLWHPKLNQMVLGCGDGNIKIYYDPDKSNRGAKLCVVKKRAKIKSVQAMVDQNIITPYALPMFREEKPRSTRKQDEKSRKDPIKSKRPDLPVSGPGVGGRVGAKGATLSQYVVQGLVLRKPDERDKDPRAAILRHAEEASKNPYWVSPAYKKTQPETIFHESDEEEDDDEPIWKKAKLT